MKLKIYTLGYEKKSIHEFIDILKEANVNILVDVRERAWSYKRDFCKTKFSAELKKGGIEYVHIRNAGNPRAFRTESISRDMVLSKYKRYLVKTKAGIPEINTLLYESRSAGKNICLTCFEREHDHCHRSIITDYLKSTNKSLQISHL